MYSIIFSVLITLTVICDSSRILVVVPTPSISHQVVFRPLTLELVNRGHEVVVVTTDPLFAKGKAPVNYTEIDLHDISYDLFKIFVDATAKTPDVFKKFELLFERIQTVFEHQLLSDEVQKLLNNKKQKFDLLFIESWMTSTLALTHVFKIPTILLSTLGPLPGIFEIVGAPTHLSFYPLAFRQRLRNMSVWEKMSEYYSTYLLTELFAKNEALGDQKMKKIFGSDFPPLNELKNNVDMVFLNVYPIWDFNRPIPPNVIYLGCLHQSRPKTLPQDLKSYLDSSTNGVIYMSLGTNVRPSVLPQEAINVFLKVFATLPYNVLWKWDLDELEGRPSNVNISKWFPQSDLLNHPNIKLFITQGGLQSTDESITAGVPLVGIPMLGDQWFNTEMYVVHKIGLRLDMETLSEDGLMNAINTVLSDSSYRANIKRLGNLMKDQPQTSLERAIWWTEYVLRHGGARHLRSPAANITWTEYLELEIVAILLIAFLVVTLILFFVVKFTIRLVFSRSKLKTN